MSLIGNILSNTLGPYKNHIFALKIFLAVLGFVFNHISISTALGTFIVILLIRFIIGMPDGDLVLSYYEKFGKSVDALNGNVIWITGASTGIGEGLAYELAKGKVKLVLSARSEDKLQNVKKRCMKIGSMSDNDVLVIPFDMTDNNKHEWAFSTVLKHFGKLDVLVSNAGRYQMAYWQDIELDVDKALFDLNVFSLLNLARIVTKHFLSVGGGKHVVMSSASAIIGCPIAASYGASKWALNGYFEALRFEKGKVISINVLCPGPVESNIMSDIVYDKLDKQEKEAPRTISLMPTERCAQLSVIAMANDIKEAWISNINVLLLTYLFQYFPALAKWICHNVEMINYISVVEVEK